MVSLLSEFRATLPFLQLRSGERDQNIINEVGAALLPRSGLVLWSKADISPSCENAVLKDKTKVVINHFLRELV